VPDPAVAVAAPPAADLSVRSATALTPTPERAGRVTVVVVVRNAGPGVAAAGVVRFYLSADARSSSASAHASRCTRRTPSTTDSVFDLRASVPLTISSDDPESLGGQDELRGESALTYASVSHVSEFQVDSPAVSGRRTERATGTTLPGTLRVVGGTIAFRLGTTAAADEAHGIAVLVDPGLPQEVSYTLTGSSFGFPVEESGTELLALWRSAWTRFHRGDALQQRDGPWLVDGFRPVAGDETLARRTYSETRGGTTIVETWEIVRTAPGG